MNQSPIAKPVTAAASAAEPGKDSQNYYTFSSPSWARGVRVTEAQLQAVAMRCREELSASLRRTGSATVATLNDNVLTVRVEHSLAAAEHQLMRRETGRAFFQHYIEELAEQMYPEFRRHVEHILPCRVTYVQVKVDCDADSIVFTFGLRPIAISIQ